MMELADEPSNNNTTTTTTANEPPPACGLHSKRLKERENALLQTTLMSRMETDSGSGTGQQSAEEEQSNHKPASAPLSPDTETEEDGLVGNVATELVEEERTLTDHLNKRLLSSFLEKLNQRDLALPGVQRLDCAVADEDWKRAEDDW